MKHIIGLDLSMCHTGWADYDLVNDNMTFGVIEPPERKSKKGEKLDVMAKLSYDLDRFEYVLSALKPILDRPANDLFVVIEDFAPNAKGRSVLQAAGIGFLVRRQLRNAGIQFVTPSPTAGKKFLTGKGNTGKEIIIKEVLKRYGIDVDDDNMADAINMCMIGRALFGHYEKMTVFQLAVVKDLLKIVPPAFQQKEAA